MDTTKGRTVLIIDDNPVTRKLVRVALQAEGYTVVEAANGRTAQEVLTAQPVALILQDLILPDCDGLDLVKQLRALPEGAGIPIIAFSGFLERIREIRKLEAGFSDFLVKPVEPSQLVATVKAHLAPPATSTRSGQGRRVLVVDNDPLQRKLLKTHLEVLGLVVDTAEDGQDALDQARFLPPEAIISDVVMPRLDGFRLSEAVRQDPLLAHVPLVLVSSFLAGDKDRQLAERVGAHNLVLRTPNYGEVIEALFALLDAPSSPQTRPTELPLPEYGDRLAERIEEFARHSSSIASYADWLEAKLTILAGLAETVKRATQAEPLVDEMLYRALEASGAPKGVAYLVEPDGRVALRAHVGYLDASASELDDFFGHLEVARDVLDRRLPVELSSAQISRATEAELLGRAGAAQMFIVPIVSEDKPLGILMIACTPETSLTDYWEDRGFFGSTVATQVGQAIALARTMSQLRDSLDREKAARAEAEQALRLRDEFISVAAHELKSPLTSLRGFSQLMIQQVETGDNLDRTRVRHALEVIIRQTQKMARLVDQMLDVSRLNTGQLQISRVMTDVSALAAGMVEAIRPTTVKHTLQLRSPEKVRALVDPLRLEQVIANLVDNAIKYSPGGPIEVEVATPDSRTVQIAVKDHGPGIPPEHRGRLFSRYYRAHGADFRSGLGLGLYVCRQIAELHGGHISAEFPKDGGTRFVVTLPTHLDASPAEAMSQS